MASAVQSSPSFLPFRNSPRVHRFSSLIIFPPFSSPTYRSFHSSRKEFTQVVSIDLKKTIPLRTSFSSSSLRLPLSSVSSSQENPCLFHPCLLHWSPYSSLPSFSPRSTPNRFFSSCSSSHRQPSYLLSSATLFSFCVGVVCGGGLCGLILVFFGYTRFTCRNEDEREDKILLDRGSRKSDEKYSLTEEEQEEVSMPHGNKDAIETPSLYRYLSDRDEEAQRVSLSSHLVKNRSSLHFPFHLLPSTERVLYAPGFLSVFSTIHRQPLYVAERLVPSSSSSLSTPSSCSESEEEDGVRDSSSSSPCKGANSSSPFLENKKESLPTTPKEAPTVLSSRVSPTTSYEDSYTGESRGNSSARTREQTAARELLLEEGDKHFNQEKSKGKETEDEGEEQDKADLSDSVMDEGGSERIGRRKRRTEAGSSRGRRWMKRGGEEEEDEEERETEGEKAVKGEEGKVLLDRQGIAFKQERRINEMWSPSNSDYSHSGYSKGHLAAVALHKKSAEDLRSTFSLGANIIPQNQAVNANQWFRLEALSKNLTDLYEEVFVVSGPLWLPRDLAERHPQVSVHLLKESSADHLPLNFHRTSSSPSCSQREDLTFSYKGCSQASSPLKTLGGEGGGDESSTRERGNHRDQGYGLHRSASSPSLPSSTSLTSACSLEKKEKEESKRSYSLTPASSLEGSRGIQVPLPSVSSEGVEKTSSTSNLKNLPSLSSSDDFSSKKRSDGRGKESLRTFACIKPFASSPLSIPVSIEALTGSSSSFQNPSSFSSTSSSLFSSSSSPLPSVTVATGADAYAESFRLCRTSLGLQTSKESIREESSRSPLSRGSSLSSSTATSSDFSDSFSTSSPSSSPRRSSSPSLLLSSTLSPASHTSSARKSIASPSHQAPLHIDYDVIGQRLIPVPTHTFKIILAVGLRKDLAETNTIQGVVKDQREEGNDGRLSIFSNRFFSFGWKGRQIEEKTPTSDMSLKDSHDDKKNKKIFSALSNDESREDSIPSGEVTSEKMIGRRIRRGRKTEERIREEEPIDEKRVLPEALFGSFVLPNRKVIGGGKNVDLSTYRVPLQFIEWTSGLDFQALVDYAAAKTSIDREREGSRVELPSSNRIPPTPGLKHSLPSPRLEVLSVEGAAQPLGSGSPKSGEGTKDMRKNAQSSLEGEKGVADHTRRSADSSLFHKISTFFKGQEVPLDFSNTHQIDTPEKTKGHEPLAVSGSTPADSPGAHHIHHDKEQTGPCSFSSEAGSAEIPPVSCSVSKKGRRLTPASTITTPPIGRSRGGKTRPRRHLVSRDEDLLLSLDLCMPRRSLVSGSELSSLSATRPSQERDEKKNLLSVPREEPKPGEDSEEGSSSRGRQQRAGKRDEGRMDGGENQRRHRLPAQEREKVFDFCRGSLDRAWWKRGTHSRREE
ncbi:dna rna non-specific endonuclease [Cystoisospora suis]|uniref:Dna rna non-specific endonuclease n=1 Tax=Cystoisospora suis TaxID=483139 RepID=A0A2C6KY92_9APIC|nr:dna rna non-specific endonuclease [Cystoisospora suis]